MPTLSWARSVVAGLLTASFLLMSVHVGFAKCDPSTDPDKTDVANARAAVDANCNCAAAASHGAYVSCAAQQADAVLANRSCRGRVKRCAAKSTCGKSGFTTCCRTSSKGKTSCFIKASTIGCAAPKGGSACTGNLPSCCDACTPTGCVSTTSTTTSTSTSTSTTIACLTAGQRCSDNCFFSGGFCEYHCGEPGNPLICVTLLGGGRTCATDGDCSYSLGYRCISTGDASCAPGYCEIPCP